MAWDSYVSGRGARRRWLLTLALFVTMGGAGPVRAAEPAHDAKQQAKARFVAGQSHYNLNEFTEALREFKEAYRLYPDPVFLFNLGQCERQLDHYEEAIRFYRSFLREDPKAPNRQDVLHKIEEMETALKSKEAEEKSAAVPPPPPLEPPVPPAPGTAGTSPAGEAVTAPAAAPTVLSKPTTAPEDSAASPAGALPPAAPPASAEPTDSATATIDLSTPSSEPEVGPAPIYKRWWFWTAAAAVAIGAGVGIYAATASDGPAIPSSELGSRKVF